MYWTGALGESCVYWGRRIGRKVFQEKGGVRVTEPAQTRWSAILFLFLIGREGKHYLGRLVCFIRFRTCRIAKGTR